MIDGGIDELIEIVGHDLGRKPHSNSFCALGEQQWKFDRKVHGLFLSPVIGELPFGDLRTEYYLEPEFRKPGLDVPRCCSPVPGKDVPPVSLGIDQQVLLPDLHHGIPYAGIPMRVILHGLPHYIGHLVVTPVVHLLQGVHDPSLHGFKPILNGGHRTLQDYI